MNRKPKGNGHALQRIAGNLTGATRAGGDNIMAWYVEHPVQWPYLSDAALEASIDGLTNAYAGLAGRVIHRRVTPAEYPVSTWARALDADTPNPPNPKAWFDYLAATQRVLFDRPMSEPVCFLGVEVGRQSILDRARSARRDQAAAAAAAGERLATELSQVEAALAGIATPATQLQLEWLTHRSVGLGLPTPHVSVGAGQSPLDDADMQDVFDQVDVDPIRPFSRALRVVGASGRNGADPVERFVTVMSVGRMEDQRIPENAGPWLARALQYAGAEISVHGKIQTGEEAAGELQKKINRLLDQHAQHTARGLHVPLDTQRSIGHAVHVSDVMKTAWDTEAVSFKGHVRVAIDGATEKEALERAEALRLHMREQRIEVKIMACQEGAAREFIPGEKVATTEYTRRMPIRLYAQGVPQATGGIGDRQGLRLGYVDGKPFMWGLHRAMENDRSGVTPVVGEQGSGKSYLMGAISALSTLQGVHTTVVDPPGTLAAVTRWAPIADHSAVLDIMSTEFSPYAVFPERRTADFYTHEACVGLEGAQLERKAWELSVDAEKEAKFERYQLTLDCLRAVLGPELGANPETELLLSEAIRANNSCKASSSVKGVLRELRVAANKTGDRHALRLVDSLEHIAELPRARNWMLAAAQTNRMIDARLLVMTMDNLQMPSDPDPAKWSTSERLSVPLLALAMHFASARVYAVPAAWRKLAVFDESHYLRDWPSMRALLAKMERQSRKYNIRALIGSQDPDTTMLAQDASKALISDVIVGQVSDPDDQRKCADLMHLDRAFASELGHMRKANDHQLAASEKRRDFLMRVDGQVGRVQFTLDEVPELAALLQTTPRQNTARDLVLDQQEGWFVR